MTTTARNTEVDYDVVICGGGLAGLCLAKQLHDADLALSTLVCERLRSPLPVSAFKVGESTIEVGAYYLAEIVGARTHLEEHHLEKLGLRYFYPKLDSQLPEEPEFGVARFLPMPSYQVDRGILEEYLREVVAATRTTLLEGVRVVDVELGDGDAPHSVTYEPVEDGAAPTTVRCRWVIDAMGRRRFLQRKLGLAKPLRRRHNAVWFRVAHRVDVNRAVTGDREEWHRRVSEPRWHSTNHFMFRGGWLWAIPLSPGHTSLGIVTAEEIHPFESLRTRDGAYAWFLKRVPEFADQLRSAHVLDFRVLRNYSHSSLQVYSPHRWACVGEAGVFVDPYYSVGTNIIGYANGFVTKMIRDDYEERLDREFVSHANRWYLSLTETLTHSIQSAYPFHDNAVIMTLKTIWDFYVGWGFSDPQFYSKTYLDVAQSVTISGLGSRAVSAQTRMIELLSRWSERYRGKFGFDFIDYFEDLPTLRRLFVQNLPGPRCDGFASVLEHLRDALDRIEELAHVIFYMALEDALPDDADRVRSRGWLNVSAIGLDPCHWEPDGLFIPKTRPRLEQLASLEQEIRRLFRTEIPGVTSLPAT